MARWRKWLWLCKDVMESGIETSKKACGHKVAIDIDNNGRV